MPKLLCVHGNIGAGKSTYIAQKEGFIQKQEPVEDWDEYFTKYYAAIQADTSTCTLSQQCDIIEFQVLTTLSRLEQYSHLDPDWNYVFERSIQESYECFCPVLKKYLTTEQYKILKDFMKEAMKLEPVFDENVYLRASTDVLLRRIRERSRPGEENIDQKFLDELQKYYSTFQQRNNSHNTPVQNTVYVIGPVSSGKTTFIRKFSAVCKTQTEPITYWEPYLSMHLANVENPVRSEADMNTFLFQLKCLVSRLKFRKPKQIHERIILEEPYVFMEQYKHLFTPTQYKLLRRLYTFFADRVFDVKNATVLYIKTSEERQIQNVIERGRMNEDKIYTPEYIHGMNRLYENMLQSPEFKAIKEKGNLYTVEYE